MTTNCRDTKSHSPPQQTNDATIVYRSNEITNATHQRLSNEIENLFLFLSMQENPSDLFNVTVFRNQPSGFTPITTIFSTAPIHQSSGHNKPLRKWLCGSGWPASSLLHHNKILFDKKNKQIKIVCVVVANYPKSFVHHRRNRFRGLRDSEVHPRLKMGSL